jgi:hypothetical protein
LRMSALRSSMGVCDQLVKARRPAATASSTSFCVAMGTCSGR